MRSDFLTDLINAVSRNVIIDKSDQREIIKMLNTQEKVFIFNRWLSTMMKDGILTATPKQVYCAAGSADRLEWPM